MSQARSKIFQVAAADFSAIWSIDEWEDWNPPFVVREGGVFVPPPSKRVSNVATPAGIGAVSHPTGNPDEPVLPFPCSLEEMISWAQGTVGEFSNQALVSWMRGRVTQHSDPMCKSPPLPFQIDEEDAHQLLPDLKPSRPFPTFPCSIEALFEWCDDDEGRHGIAPPSNESVLRLMNGKLKLVRTVSTSPTDKLTTIERNSRQNMIEALDGEVTSALGVAGRRELNQVIANLCIKKRINLNKGKGAPGAILAYIELAYDSGNIDRPSPKIGTISKVLDEILEEQIAN